MCGVSNLDPTGDSFLGGGVVGRTLAAGATGGLSEFTRKSPFGVPVNNPVAGLFKNGGGSKDYTPTTLAQGDPKLMLAQSGGAPLLAQIAMGTKVDDALAGYFGKTSGEDFKQYYASLSSADQSAIDSVKNQLDQIQNNTDLRNTAVQKVIDDFPNIAKQSYQTMLEGNKKTLGQFDDVTKQVLDRAGSQLAAKFSASGGFSSGAFNEGLAKAATDVAIPRAQLAAGLSDRAESFNANAPLEAANMRLSEVSALRGFQNLMLGQGAGNGFSAAQAALGRAQQTNLFNAGATNDATRYNAEYDNNQSNALFGALGSLGGTALGAAFGGPMGAMAGKSIGSNMFGPSGGGMAAPRLNMGGSGYGDGSTYNRYMGGA